MSHPWSAASDPLPEKPAQAEYGWVDEKGWQAGTRETLVARCRLPEPPQAVWTPDAPRLVFPGEVPWLRAVMEETVHARPRSRAPLGFVLAGLGAIVLERLSLAVPAALWVGVACLAIGALMYVTDRTRRRQQARSLTVEEIDRARGEIAHQRWLRQQPVTYTNYLGWIIAACGAVQMLTGIGDSIDRAGIVPEAVRAGEWWRLVTGTLLHGDPLHFFMNYGALAMFARQLEVHTHRAYVPLVYLVTAVAGSVASVALPPESRAVGASGGILGLVGALVALGLLRARHLPPHFTRSLWTVVGATALLGLVGYAFIDNAAHAGGFVAGVACGLLFLPHRDAPSVAPGPIVRGLGDASLGAVGLAGVWAIVRMAA